MTIAELSQIASLIATIVTSGLAILTYVREGRAGNRSRRFNPGRHIAIVAVLATISCIAAVFSFYDRNNRPAGYGDYIAAWGINSPLTYHMTVQTDRLGELKEKGFRLLLILRIPYAERDRMTDKVIEKSELYTIAGPAIVLASSTQGTLRFNANQMTPVEFNLAAVPSSISREQITSLGDVERLGGRLLASTATTVQGGPPAN